MVVDAAVMHRRRWQVVAPLLFALSVPVHAKERAAEPLVVQLLEADDPGLRIDAAKALAARGEAHFVPPLCRALADREERVREAAATALGQSRQKSALECLRARTDEANPVVKASIAQAIQTLEALTPSEPPPPPRKGDKLYVAVGSVIDNTGREGAKVLELAREAMQSKLLTRAGIAVAPEGEPAAKARAILKKHKLQGYLLQAVIDPPEYSDAKLTVSVRVTMWSYPGKALEGAFSPRLSYAGVEPRDFTSEDELIREAIGRAIDSFVQATQAF